MHDERLNALLAQIDRLEQRLAEQQVQIDALANEALTQHPLASRVLLASRDGVKQWQERTVYSGAIVDFIDGRKCNNDLHAAGRIDPGYNMFLLAIRDGGNNAETYVEIAPLAIRWGKVKTAWTPATGTIVLTPTISDTDATANGDPDATCQVVRGAANNSVPIFYVDLAVDTHPVPYIPYPENKGVCFPFAVSYSATGSAGGSTNDAAETFDVQDCEHKTVTLTIQNRSQYSTTDEVFYGYNTILTFKHGVLTRIQGETRTTIASPVDCPP